MSKRDPLVLIEDIMLAIQKIGRYTSQLNHDAFLTDELCFERDILDRTDACFAAKELAQPGNPAGSRLIFAGHDTPVAHSPIFS